MTDIDRSQHRNRLANEKSPYLLQHAANPVDWYPWGDEAFDKARREDCPIFLSIGYSTCHWCHVMERESFENEAIADILNRHFVAIKVDREERPDVDRIYMTAVQALTGSGGWPLSAFLTPELEPFYAGTYFPPESRYGQPGFKSLLLQLHDLWTSQRQRVTDSATQITTALKRLTAPLPDHPLDIDRAAAIGCERLRASYDPHHGGFGGAPKFPRPVAVSFLMHYGWQRGDSQAVQMALETVRQMWQGGLHDHLGGGFHRYSVDPYWRVPHFEKMLYDQAQLIMACVDAYQLSQDSFFGRVAATTADYVLRDLTDVEGGFYSAEDADSAPDAERPEEKIEGAFYLWQRDEIEALLDQKEAELFVAVYGVSASGNTLNDPHGEFGTGNVLYRARPVSEAASELGLDPGTAESILEQSRQTLLDARAARPRPHLDDKVITAWNGLMIAALARAGSVFGEPRYIAAAAQAADFLLLQAREDQLRRRYREGETRFDAQLDDHACLVLGLLDLYQATLSPQWLAAAETWATTLVDRFADPVSGAFFDSPASDPSLLVRTQESYDGAEPSGNAVALEVLWRLGNMLDRDDWTRRVEQALARFSARLMSEPTASPALLRVALRQSEPARQVVLAGSLDEPNTQALLSATHQVYDPQRVLLHASREMAEHSQALAEIHRSGGEPRAYVCRHFACELPLKTPADLLRSLRQQTSAD